MEFTKYPKTPRLFRNCVITEKIDGTNTAVVIRERPAEFQIGSQPSFFEGAVAPVGTKNGLYGIWAQSRNRFITPASDNAGFGAWVHTWASELVELLGEGVHFGEWWGKGIQRGYGLDHKAFSLFNTGRWNNEALFESSVSKGLEYPDGLGVVPVLWNGEFTTEGVRQTLDALKVAGSAAAWNEGRVSFDRPEGVVIYHTASGQVFKALIENDEIPKGVAEVKPDGWKGDAQ